ncbi:hypothetical protein D3C72_1933830 [compost metagenome]
MLDLPCFKIKIKICIDIINFPTLSSLDKLHHGETWNWIIVNIRRKGIGSAVLFQIFTPKLLHIGSIETHLFVEVMGKRTHDDQFSCFEKII